MPEDDPLVRLERGGPGSLALRELVALVLGAQTPRRRALEAAEDLLGAFSTLGALGRVGYQDLARVAGTTRAAAVAAAIELGRRVAAAPVEQRAAIRSAGDVFALLGPVMRHLDCEHFRVVLLDRRHQVVRVAPVAVGGLDSAPIHPREVFKDAIRHSAAAVILVHNHPSGSPEPSGDDLRITARLQEAGRIVGIEVLDHLIIGDGRFVSLRERGAIGT
jgi:DNA repair protein RadC